jgi:hypothetical protein
MISDLERTETNRVLYAGFEPAAHLVDLEAEHSGR